MLLPKRLVRRWEPVVGMALAGDSTLGVAALIALAAGERLLLFITEALSDDEALLHAVSAAGFQRNDDELYWLRKIGTQNFFAALEPFGERVIVLPRLGDHAAGRVDPGGRIGCAEM